MGLRKLFPLLFLLLLVSCSGNEEGAAMKIKWQTPADWGTLEYGRNSDGSFIHKDYYFSDDSLNGFVAQRFPTKREMSKRKEERITFYRELMFDEQIVHVETSKEYQMEICGQDAVVLEMLFRPNKTAVSASYDVSSIDIWFSLDRTLYSISLASNERDEDVSDARIEQFWNMIENIDCPSEDSR